MFWVHCVLLSVVVCSCCAESVSYTYIFETNETFPYVHNAMLERVEDDFILAAFQAGTKEGATGQVAMMSESSNGGQNWSKPWLLFPERIGPPQWAPILHFDQDSGVLFVWFVQNWAVFQATSLDFGKTWSEPEGIFAASYFLNMPETTWTGNKLLVDVNGRWILGLDSLNPTCAYYLVSDSRGAEWTGPYGNVSAPGDYMEPALAQFNSSHILSTLRTSTGFAYQTFSADGGISWSHPTSNNVPACDSKTALWNVPQSPTIYLSTNPGNRSHLELFQLKTAFQPFITLENDPNLFACYPTVITSNQTILTAYSVYPPDTSKPRLGIKLAIIQQ